MKTAVNIALIVGTISLIAAVISKLTFTPVKMLPGNLEACSLLNFANTCFLISIILTIVGKQTK